MGLAEEVRDTLLYKKFYEEKSVELNRKIKSIEENAINARMKIIESKAKSSILEDIKSNDISNGSAALSVIKKITGA